MADTSIRRTSPERVYGDLVDPGSKVPKPEEIFLNPLEFIKCLRTISPKLDSTKCWWSVAGRAGENLLDVHVNPTRIVILCDSAGMDKIVDALKEYSPTPPEEKVEQLKRAAESEGKQYPVLARAKTSSLVFEGVQVTIHADLQMKVGDWDWGDPYAFDPVFVNVAGTQVPVMPLRLRSEFYITLGWLDRAKLVTDATLRAHHFLKDMGATTTYH